MAVSPLLAPILRLEILEGDVLALGVAPEIRDDGWNMKRLKLMLACLTRSSDVRKADADADIYIGASDDPRLRGSSRWVTAAELNDAIARLEPDPVQLVRPATQDMIVHVVTRRPMVKYHAVELGNRLQRHGVVSAFISEDRVYAQRVIRLFVPEIGIGISAERLEQRIRDVLSFRMRH